MLSSSVNSSSQVSLIGVPGDASAIPLLMKFIKLPGFGLNKVEGVLDVEVGLLTVVLGLADGIDKGVS